MLRCSKSQWDTRSLSLLGITADLIRAESPAILVLLATALVQLGERRVHGYNYAYLTTVEGEELIPVLMKKYYRMLLLLPFLACVSAMILPHNWVPFRASLAGISLIFLGFVLRIWSMRSLGRLWTQRCIYIADMPRAANGPYRFLKHPEYLARAVEGFGFLLFFGANPLSLLFWLRTMVLANRIVKVESRQLHELSAAPLHLLDASSTVGASKL
jgi:isoprenylcysteine carboxyl methyltransferase (ICMT) family protein YpbQ